MKSHARRRLSSWSLGQKSLLVTLLPIFVAATALIVMTKALESSRDAEDEVQRGLRALAQIHSVHAALAEAASGVRGFILTRDSTFLNPYLRAEDQLRFALQQLESDLKDPVQRQTLADIAELVNVKLSNLEALQTRAQEHDAGSMLEYSRDNKVLLDRLRDRIAFMEQREKQIVAGLEQDLSATRQTSQWLIVSAMIAAFISATVFSQRYTRDLIRRVRRIRENAGRIGHGHSLVADNSGHHDELAELDRLVVQTGNTLDAKLEELRQATAAAEKANLAKTDFLSRTSHELRTPLNAIIGFSELLVDAALPEKHQQRLNTIHRSAYHLLQLVNDLLDLSRLEAGKLTLDIQPVDLRDTALIARDIVTGRADAKNITLELMTGSASLAIAADAHRLLQVLINLLDNAIKFSPPGSQVSLKATPMARDGHLGIETVVLDQGPGVSPAQEKYLFSPFQRLDSQTEGIGLGLAISHSLAEQMAGYLRYAPADQQGSCFSLWLPTAAKPTARPLPTAVPHPFVPEQPASLQSSSTALCWLIVSNSEELCMLVETVATRFGAGFLTVDAEHSGSAETADLTYLLITDALPGDFQLPEQGTMMHGIYLTPEPPDTIENDSFTWLPPPLTALRLRRHLQEAVYV